MINELWKKYKDMIPYLIFGVLTTVVNFVGFWFFSYVLGINYQIANIIAYFVSVVFAYVTINYGYLIHTRLLGRPFLLKWHHSSYSEVPHGSSIKVL
jgi:Predicted membrane protein